MKKSKQQLLLKQHSANHFLKGALAIASIGLIGTRLMTVALHANEGKNTVAAANCTSAPVVAAPAKPVADSPTVSNSDASRGDAEKSQPKAPSAPNNLPTFDPTAGSEQNIEIESLHGHSVLAIRSVESGNATEIESSDEPNSTTKQAQYVLTPLPFQQQPAEQATQQPTPAQQDSEQPVAPPPAESQVLVPPQELQPTPAAAPTPAYAPTPEAENEAQSVLNEPREEEKVAQQPTAPLPPMPQSPEAIPSPSGRAQAVVVDVKVKPLSSISLSLDPPADGKVPFNLAASAFGQHGEADINSVNARNWSPWMYYWQASEFCHNPLYFEEPNLERYGHSTGCDCTQSALSGAHFFATIPLLPYKVLRDTPCCCYYTLGHSRPGNCNAWEPHW